MNVPAPPKLKIDVPKDKLSDFCRRHHISLFGSILRGDFGPESDIDVLVEFESEHVPRLIRLAGMELEFATIRGGHKVDMNTPNSLSRYFRDQILSEVLVHYVRA